jgi:hypothetical protein
MSSIDEDTKMMSGEDKDDDDGHDEGHSADEEDDIGDESRNEDESQDKEAEDEEDLEQDGEAEDNENDDDNTDEDDEEEDSDEEDPEKTLMSTTKKRYHTPKIFQDAITVIIPLDVTADLKIAVKRTRDKRIKSIYKKFPLLEKEAKKQDLENNQDEDPLVDDDDEENAKDKEEKKPVRKKKKLEHVPQPDQYGSVLDYLEAKYVKGVMLDEDDEDGQMLDDKSEGQGSVYSKDSFLDDTDLQRDVAEQVMCSTTLTKLELEQEDGDFFVNVGNLEVENDEYGDNYDPLQDKETTKTAKKKRKKSSASAASAASAKDSPLSKKKKTTKTEDPASAKSKKSTTSAMSTKTVKSTQKDGKPSERAALVKAARKLKTRVDALYKKAVGMVKKMTEEELPKRKTKLKVALTCPPSKKPGDDITFT